MDFPSSLVPVIICIGLNILAFAVFTRDKFRAKMKIERSSENSLLLFAALGPFGALTSMVGFRHKTRHVKFFLVPVFSILHVVLILLLWPWLS